METTNNDRAIMELIIRLFRGKVREAGTSNRKENDSYDGRRGAIS